jgi:hypothetical protein
LDILLINDNKEIKKIKKTITIVILSILLSNCKKTQDPCYVGTFESAAYSCGTTKKSSTIVLRNDGTGRITDPACASTPELIVDFSFKNRETSFYTVSTTKVTSGGSIIESNLWYKFGNSYLFLQSLNGIGDTVFMCENNDLNINDESFEDHVGSNIWKRK